MRFTFLLFGFLWSTVVVAQKPSEYQLKLGDKFTVLSEAKQTIEQTLMGQNLITRQTLETLDQYEVVKITSSGYRLKTTGLTRRHIYSSPMSNFAMDSERSDDQSLGAKVLTGKSFFIEMSSYGEVIKIEDLDGYRDQVKIELAGKSLENQADQLLADFTDEAYTITFEQQFKIYPQPGKPDWGNMLKTQINGLPVNVETKYSWGGDTTILAVGKMSMTGEIQGPDGVMIKSSLVGTQNSTFNLDKSTGLSTVAQTQQSMEGKLEIDGVVVPMKINTEVNLIIKR